MGTIELRGFGKLQKILSDKGFAFPEMFEVGEETTGHQLLEKLGVVEDSVEAIFINGGVEPLSHPVKPGDRVALLPPGTPGPYRVMLGIAGSKDRE